MNLKNNLRSIVLGSFIILTACNRITSEYNGKIGGDYVRFYKNKSNIMEVIKNGRKIKYFTNDNFRLEAILIIDKDSVTYLKKDEINTDIFQKQFDSYLKEIHKIKNLSFYMPGGL